MKYDSKEISNSVTTTGSPEVYLSTAKNDLVLQIAGNWMQACILGSNTSGFSHS